MSYSTRAEVREMLKDDALNVIIGDTYEEDEVEREAKIGPIIDAAIEDADAEIDGYLAKRYRVPFDPVPRVLNKFSKDIAIYNLFSRIGIDEDSDQKNYLNRYNAAIKFFTLAAAFQAGQHDRDVSAWREQVSGLTAMSPRCSAG